MFKFSQLVSKTSEPLNVRLLLQKLYKSTSNSAKSPINKTNNNSAKSKTNRIISNKNLRKSTNACTPMESQKIKNATTTVVAESTLSTIATGSSDKQKQGAEIIDLPNKEPKVVDSSSDGGKANHTGSRVSDINSNADNKGVVDANCSYAPSTLPSNQIYSPYRRWEHTQLGTQLNETPTECIYDNGLPFTLFSYNILAQDLLVEHQSLYRNHTQSALDWKTQRLSNLRREILTVRPDILCLQEVQEIHLPGLLESIRDLNFDYVYKKKTGYRTDGCAILYNRNLFEIVTRHDVEYMQPDTFQLNRDNIAIIAQLCLKNDPSTRFLVATTHLLFNPRRQDVRLAQIQVLLAELDRLSIIDKSLNSTQPKRMPIILTGDFNLQPYSAPYRLLTKGKLHYQYLTKMTLEFPARKSTEQLLSEEFLPSHLGITDNCQHIDLLINRRQRKEAYDGTTRLHHTERDSSTIPCEDLFLKYPLLFSTGILSHDLNLASVYQHQLKNGQQEGSTYQDEWITVDYIFYSKYFSPHIQNLCEGYLKLLSRYTLQTVEQCKSMGMIPNADLGSDHLSLGAKFYLKYPRKQYGNGIQ